MCIVWVDNLHIKIKKNIAECFAKLLLVTLSVMNLVLEEKIQVINDEKIKYEDYYKIFNILRTVLGMAFCPILGLMADLSEKCFKFEV